MAFFRGSFWIVVIVGLLAGYIGWQSYHYFFDKHYPMLVIKGIDDQGWYADEIQCALEGSDAYKVSEISLMLDDKPLCSSYKINSKKFAYPFSIATRSLTNGKHTLVAQVVNGTRSRHAIDNSIHFWVDNSPLQAAFVRPDTDFKVFQGRTLHVQFQTNKEIKRATVYALSSMYDCFKEAKNSPIYECFIPISCDEKPNEYLLTLEIVDRVGNTLTLEQKFNVIMFPFKKQTLKITSSHPAHKDEEATSQAFEAQVEKLAQQSPKQKLWNGNFIAPIEIQSVSTEFGTIRTTQERGRYMHKAVDVLNVPRAVVWATQDGIVVMKDSFEHSGKTVVIDHGHGILSMFFHLENFSDIEVGQKIKQGNPLGTLGKTGYATGYHLHWELRINNIPVDPLQWIKPNF